MSEIPVKKIAIVTPDLIAGGVTRAYALAQALAHAGYAVEIFGVKLGNGVLYPAPPANIKVTEIKGCTRLYCLFKLVMKLDGDVVYAIKPRLSSYGVALLKRRLHRSPVVLDIDDWEMAEIEAARKQQGGTRPRRSLGFADIGARIAGRARSLLRTCCGWLDPANARYLRALDKVIHKADAITVNTRFLQAQYGGTYVPQCKDPGLFNPARHDPDTSRRLHGLSSYFVLMFPGTARPHKGLEDILAAIEALQNPDLRLVIVGGRSCSESYIAQLMQRWERWIIRLPAFSQEQMPEVVAAAHVVVVPQRETEIARAQFPMKLTDAMAMAKPIITTSVGEIPEIVGDSGYILPPSRPDHMVEVIECILNDPQRDCSA